MASYRLKQVVELLEAKPNPMFSEEQRALVRFLRFHFTKGTCAHCGKKRKTLWTMLSPFRVADLGPIVAVKSENVYPALTPVCTGHLMAPDVEEVADAQDRH